MERLDKIIAVAMNISRADAKSFVKKGLVTVNGVSVKDTGFKADEKS